MKDGLLLELALFAAAGALFLAGYGFPERGAPPFELVPRDPGFLRVVTWNVGGSSTHTWRSLDDEHVQHVASVLAEIDADLIFLQEVHDAAQAARLSAELDGHMFEVAGQRGRHVVAFARRGTLERLSLEAQSSGLLVRYTSERGATVAALGLHADVSSAFRRNREIGAAVDELVARPEPAKLLLGDLNLDLDLDKRRDLFTDDEHRDVETYNYVALRLVDAARGAGATAEPDRRLDYVFVAAFDVRVAGPLHDRRAGDMDHDPVVVDLAVR